MAAPFPGCADDAIVVGIMAYNEARNIARTLRSILTQTVAHRIARIVVVASGCTDETCAIVAAAAAAEPRIVLIEEGVRAGKVVALNTFLAAVPEPIVVVPSADLVLEPDTLEHLIRPFDDPAVGMAGAHPVPTNGTKRFVGFAVNLMWELHHRIACVEPKMGELVAFRNRVSLLDPAAISDESSVERQIRAAGLRVVYAPDARVHNRGPDTLREFIAQRERWCVANMQTVFEHHGRASTLSLAAALRAARELYAESRPRLDWLVLAALVEGWCRARAYVNLAVMRRGDRYRVWEPLRSTKRVVPEES